jgi:WD40 repeat protein
MCVFLTTTAETLMRRLLGSLTFVAAALTCGADEPKKPTIEEDRKAIQGTWELVPGKNPEGMSGRLTFEKDQLTIDLKRPGLNVSNMLGGVDVAEMGQERFILFGGAKWPYALDGDNLSLTMSGPYNGKLVLARVGKQGGQPPLKATLRHTLKGHSNVVSGVCFSPDGKRIASASVGGDGEKNWGEVTIWDAESGKPLLTFKEHPASVGSVCFSPDGQRIASSSQEGTIKVWNPETGKESRTLKGHATGTGCVCFNTDGSYLASASEDGTLKLWHLESGKAVRTIKATDGFRMRHLSFSADGKRIATAAFNSGGTGEVQVWEAETGKELLKIEHRDVGAVYQVCFSPDGSRLAVACGFPQNALKVFDAKTGKQIVTFKSDGSEVLCVAFSPDGKRLASASAHGLEAVGERYTVRVWDAQTGQQLAVLKDLKTSARSVCFSPDGKHLASGASASDKQKVFGEVRVWDLSADVKPEQGK